MSAAALQQITEPDTEVWCSPISIGEVACLRQRGRIEISGHWKTWFRTLLHTNGWNLLPITGEIIEEAWSLLEPVHHRFTHARLPARRVLELIAVSISTMHGMNSRAIRLLRQAIMITPVVEGRGEMEALPVFPSKLKQTRRYSRFGNMKRGSWPPPKQ